MRTLREVLAIIIGATREILALIAERLDDDDEVVLPLHQNGHHEATIRTKEQL